MITVDSSSKTGISKKGKPFGTKTSNGLYWRITVEGKQLYAHRVIWEIEVGPIPEGMTVDHVNRNGLDNRLENLRLASKTQQIRNRKAWGEVPLKWVQRARSDRFRARWRSPEGTVVNAGTWDTPEEAHLASLVSRLEHLWNL